MTSVKCTRAFRPISEYEAGEQYQLPRFQGMSGMEMDYHLPRCQGVLAYILILIELQRIAFLPFALVGVCVHMYVCVNMCVRARACVCVRTFQRLIVGSHKNGLRHIRHFFTIMLAIKTPSNDILRCYSSWNLPNFEDSIRDHLDCLNLIISWLIGQILLLPQICRICRLWISIIRVDLDLF